MYPKQLLINYHMETSLEKSFAVINKDRINLALLTLLVLNVIFLWIRVNCPAEMLTKISPQSCTKNGGHTLILL